MQTDTKSLLPNVNMRRSQICYDNNDIAAYYLFLHWKHNYKGWRTNPLCRVFLQSNDYKAEANRLIFREYLGQWFVRSAVVNGIIKDVLDNCFISPINYIDWCNSFSYAGIPAIARHEISNLLAVLPAHSSILKLQDFSEKAVHPQNIHR
jgi:hypothetical protein